MAVSISTAVAATAVAATTVAVTVLVAAAVATMVLVTTAVACTAVAAAVVATTVVATTVVATTVGTGVLVGTTGVAVDPGVLEGRGVSDSAVGSEAITVAACLATSVGLGVGLAACPPHALVSTSITTAMTGKGHGAQRRFII
jgi:hypothetical protein